MSQDEGLVKSKIYEKQTGEAMRAKIEREVEKMMAPENLREERERERILRACCRINC